MSKIYPIVLRTMQEDFVFHFRVNTAPKYQIVLPYNGIGIEQSDDKKANWVTNFEVGTAVITLKQKANGSSTEITFGIETDETELIAYFTSNSGGAASLDIGYPPDNGYTVDLIKDVRPDPTAYGEPCFTVQLQDSWVQH